MDPGGLLWSHLLVAICVRVVSGDPLGKCDRNPRIFWSSGCGTDMNSFGNCVVDDADFHVRFFVGS